MSLFRELMAQTPKLAPEPAEGRSVYDELPRYRLSKQDYAEFKDEVITRVLISKLGYNQALVEQLAKKAKIDLIVGAQVHYKTYSRRSFILRFGPRPVDLVPLLVEPESSVLFSSASNVPQSEIKRRERFVARQSPQEAYQTPNVKQKAPKILRDPSVDQFAADNSDGSPAAARFEPDRLGQAGVFRGEDRMLSQEDHASPEGRSNRLAEKAAAAKDAYTKATAAAKQARKAVKAAAKNAKRAQAAADRSYTPVQGSPEPVVQVSKVEDHESPLRTRLSSSTVGEHSPETRDIPVVDIPAVILDRMQNELADLKKQVMQIVEGLDHLSYVLTTGASPA